MKKDRGYWGGLGLGPARNPPSRTRDWPVINEARSEHIQTTASAISLGVPNRPIGCRPRICFWISGSPKRRSAMGVSITAGHTTFTRMPLRAFSSAAVLVRAITPCLLAQYVPAPAKPMRPATDAMLTMAPPPPCLSICWISYFRQSHTPLRLMSITRSQSPSDCSATGLKLPSIPALLNATSKRPNFSTVFQTSASTSVAFDTSVLTNKPSPPAARTRSIVSFPSDSRRPATTTLAPAFAKSTAVSRPIPDVPPVTIPTLPCNSAVMILTSRQALKIGEAECRLCTEPSSNRSDVLAKGRGSGASLPGCWGAIDEESNSVRGCCDGDFVLVSDDRKRFSRAERGARRCAIDGDSRGNVD